MDWTIAGRFNRQATQDKAEPAEPPRWPWRRHQAEVEALTAELDLAYRTIDRLDDTRRDYERLSEAVMFAVDLASAALGGPGDGTPVGDDQKVPLVGGEPAVLEDRCLDGRPLAIVRRSA